LRDVDGMRDLAPGEFARQATWRPQERLSRWSYRFGRGCARSCRPGTKVALSKDRAVGAWTTTADSWLELTWLTNIVIVTSACRMALRPIGSWWRWAPVRSPRLCWQARWC